MHPRWLLILILPFMLLVSAQGETAASSKKYVVAFVQDTMDNDFRVAQVMAVKKRLLRHDNITFLYSDAKASSAMMIKQIEDFVAMKVDLIIASPSDEVAMVPVVEKAYRSKIPVVLIGRSVQSDQFTLFIHPDNAKIATDAAEYMAKKMRFKGTLLMLKGVPNTDVTRHRSEAFLKVMRKHEGIKIVTKTANYLRRDAIMAMEEILESGEKVDAIYSQSDSMLSGVRMVLKHRDIDPASLLMVGIDYIGEAREAIRNGTQDSTFLYPLCGAETADAAVDILNGKKLPKEIVIGTKHITKENIDDIEPIF